MNDDSPMKKVADFAAAALCVVLCGFLAYELAYGLKGDPTRMAVLLAGICALLLLPRITKISGGKDGIVVDIAQKVDRIAAQVASVKDVAQEAAGAANAAASKAGQLFERSPAGGAALGPSAPRVAGGFDIATFIAKLPAVTNLDDPQKGRFGGRVESNGRTLSGAITNYSPSTGVLSFDLTISSNVKASRQDTKAYFVLHPSFSPDIYVETLSRGRASISLRSWGAFTVGVVTDDGKTILELDLENYFADAPLKWRQS